jgi:hypothetical protein
VQRISRIDVHQPQCPRALGFAGCCRQRQLNAYLRYDDEYRAATRETIIRGLAGTIGFTPAAITVTLEPPGQPRVARALAMLIDEINHTPPVIPGDNRPITYRIARQTGI